MRFRTRAAFLIGCKWIWLEWTNRSPNTHAAIVDKANEIGAKGYDVGNAQHEE